MGLFGIALGIGIVLRFHSNECNRTFLVYVDTHFAVIARLDRAIQ
jgi:hypothetical protein